MSKFNSVEYHNDQVKKQYTNEVKTRHKNSLDFKVFIEELKGFNEDEYNVIHTLVNNASIEAIQDCIQKKKFSYDRLVLYYIKRIKDMDYQYNSVLYLNEKALIEAKDRTYDEDHHLLYGMPILVKGNIAVKGLPLTAGAAALKKNIASRDSLIVKKLKEKGAIILGLTNLSEFANYMTTDSANGYSALGGQTKNPYGSFDVGGSSAGSAVAMAKGFATATIGTETAGSIIYPASQNGVIGLKPTLGTIRQDMIIPISRTHDTAGPMTCHAKDLWVLMDAISDERIKKPNITESELSNITIGIIINEDVLETFREEDQQFIETMEKKLSKKGALIEKIKLDKDIFNYDISEVLSYEFNEGLTEFLEKNSTDPTINSLNCVIDKNKEDLENSAPYGQDLLEDALMSDYEANDIKERVDDYKNGALKIFKETFKKYDFLLTISNYMTTAYACSGNPAINFPIGFRTSGEPIGGTLIGPKNSEEEMIEIVQSYMD